MSTLLAILSLTASAWYTLGLCLPIRGTLSWRKYWLICMPADGFAALHDVAHRLYALAALIVVLLAVHYWLWKHSDRDDDDWGKRLKSWAKSHIPKPTIVQLRPAGSPA